MQDKDRIEVLRKIRLKYINIIKNLIKFHYSKKEDKFRDICVLLILHFNSIEENYIADMVTMYMYPGYPHVWGTNDVITEEERIKNDIVNLVAEIEDKINILKALVGDEKTKGIVNNITKEIYNEN